MHYAYEYNKRVVRDKNCNNPLNQKPGLYRIISSSQDASPTQEYSVPANMKNAASVLLLASTTTLTFAHHEANNGLRGESSKASHRLEEEMAVNGHTEWKHGGYSDVEPADNGHRMLEITCAVSMGQANTMMEKSGNVWTSKDWRWIIKSRISDPQRARALRCLRTEMAGRSSLIAVLGRSWMKLYLTRSRVCCVALESSSALATKAPTKAGWN
ncbi:hypothetical protein MHU86_2935 [Fragilaria crotonensis]|nr:hypothetical protein MHU86_2935 [Fragilaria crotonensis]